MPVISYLDAQGARKEKRFSRRPLLIGSDPQIRNPANFDRLVLPPARHLAPLHALIAREQGSKMPILIDLCGHDTRVHLHEILKLRMLRHNDQIHLGQATLHFREILIQTLQPGSRHEHQRCPICKKDLLAGMDVIFCPRYPTLVCRSCWFATPTCPDLTCDYPNQKVLMDTLAHTNQLRFERSLTRASDVIRRGIACSARKERDQVRFQEGDDIVYCARCQTPYHLSCWVLLDECLKCHYKIQELLNRNFKDTIRVTVYLDDDRRGE